MSREPSTRDKLGTKFAAALEADFEIHGTATIEKLRERSPEKYAELVLKYVVKSEEELGPTDFSDCQSMEDIACKLLQQIGLSEFQMTERMLAKAVEAHDRLVAELQEIAKDALQ
jgi:hypothetical protein